MMKNTRKTGMENTLEGINSRVTKPEERIMELKEWWKELLRSRTRKKGIKINEDSLKRPLGQH